MLTRDHEVKLPEGELSKTNYLVSTYPNPVRDRLTVTIDGASNETVVLQLINAVGRTVLNEEIAVGLTSKSVTFDISDYFTKAGIFYLSITQPTGAVETHRLVKQ